jgi:glycosyltransferase involved in cell wall biosynthesis
MRIYFYHTLPIRESYSEWLEHKHPGHLLYGLTHFDKHGIDCIFHRYKAEKSRFGLMLRNLFQILFCQEHFDVLYGTSFRGLELVVFLRALGFYRKPIVIWHHTAVIHSSNRIRRAFSRLFYKGFDEMFFFNTYLMERSLETGKVSKEHIHLIHWGPDLAFYDQTQREVNNVQNIFISTGKENRDFPTLIEGFKNSDSIVEIYTPKSNGTKNYEHILGGLSSLPENVHVKFVEGNIPYELGKKVAESNAVAICCYNPPYQYTLGLTTLVEAMGLSKPVICSDNPFWEIDIEKEGIGIKVPYGDAAAWTKAIRLLSEHPEEARSMGEKGRKLAESTYNLELFAKELADVLKDIKR